MNKPGIMSEIRRIIDETGTAVFATVDEKMFPRMRWVSPALLDEHPGSIFFATSPSFAKVAEASTNPNAEWMFQTKALDTIVNVRVVTEVVDAPALRSEFSEEIGTRLRTFWTITKGNSGLVILETKPVGATYTVPMKGIKETVDFT